MMRRAKEDSRQPLLKETRLGWAALAGPGPADRTVGALLRAAAQRYGTRPFARFHNETVTYAEANARANRVARAFSDLGARKGTRVGLFLTNRLEYLDLWFGLAKIGAIELPINAAYKAPQILHTLTRAEVPIVVAEAALLPELEAVLPRLGPCRLVVLDGARVGRHIVYDTLIGGAGDGEPEDAGVTDADVVAIMNTSGTTGLSKGVLLPHAQQYSLAQNMVAALGLDGRDVFYNFFPLFHNTAQAMITLPVLLTGAEMLLCEKFSVTSFWPDVTAHRVSLFYFIGEMLHLLVTRSDADAPRRSSLRAGWGIGATPGDMAAFERRYGARLGTCYGSTEGNVPVFRELGSKLPEDSVGRVIPGFEVKVVAPDGHEVESGAVGEIVQRANDPHMMMAGYDGDETATQAAHRDGWYHTGDAGRIDEQGNFYFVARIKDVIRIGGENTSGFEIEQQLLACPGVLEAAAIAVPRDIGGDDVKAVIVPAPGASLDPAAIISFCEQRLPKYSVPRYVELRSELPKTATNKVRKNVLREEGHNSSTWDRVKGEFIT